MLTLARPRTTKPSKPADARVQRSLEALANAFLSLLEKHSNEEISIKDITEEAGVSYPTFFRRFSGKDDLLNYIASEEIKHLLNLGESTITNSRNLDSGQALCDYVQSKRYLWKTLLNGGAAAVMREEFMRAAREIAETRPRVNPWLPIDLAVPFVTGGVFEILAWWMRMPEDYPKENVITLFNVLIIDSVAHPREISLL